MSNRWDDKPYLTEEEYFRMNEKNRKLYDKNHPPSKEIFSPLIWSDFVMKEILGYE